ncbi:CLUMA_CG010766, isoform B [Clunio marinus]|uniref:CLUMA_CG010766, isoform B n=1 Tax=Clunio marinus TaxID=568069 RepID=A0A1J1IAV7_9DIPT|nr:CLUMA_CG010766, isoform B [Clunio marinus]
MVPRHYLGALVLLVSSLAPSRVSSNSNAIIPSTNVYESHFRWYVRRAKYTKLTRIDGKVVLITGANTGIGKANAIDLARRGGKIYIACRDELRGQKALKEIKLASGSINVHLLKLDLASLDSVREFSKEFHKLERKLHILINNAGVIGPQRTTKDGFELTFGVNHLGHFLLTNLLLDLIKEAAPSRIVVVSSTAHKLGKITREDLMRIHNYKEFSVYSQSKLANVLFANELARKLKGTGVTVNSCHPGVVKTEIGRDVSYQTYFEALFGPWMKTVEEGAQTQIRLAVDPELENVTGKYFADCEEDTMSKYAKDEELAAWLWYLRRAKYTDSTKIPGKVVVITGANTGIGKENAIDLAKRGAKVYIACRDEQRGKAALREIKVYSGNNNVHLLQLDLASLDSIREFSKNFHKMENKLDILINNAGLVSDKKQKTKDGFDLVFGVNHLGPFLLTNLLLDMVKKATPSRIIMLSSTAHKYGKIVTDDLMNDKKYVGWNAYCHSKLANVLFANELARKLKGTGVTVNSCHPGGVKTDIFRNSSIIIKFLTIILDPWMKTAEEGAQTQNRMAVDPSLENVTGKYFADCTEDSMSNDAKDEQLAAWLYKKSADWYLRRGRFNKSSRIDGKVVLITGANTGLGKGTAIDLARRGGKIYIACRDERRGEKALTEIKLASGSSNVHLLNLDLASLDSIRKFSENFHKLETKIDVLINNAGLSSNSHRKTVDGFELTLGVNHLGPFLLTNLLLDLIKKAAPSRIIVISSSAHKYFANINKHDLMFEKSYHFFLAYGQSKLANILFSNELARKLNGTGVTVNSCHPGVIRTKITRDLGFWDAVYMLINPWLKTVEEGIQTQIRLAVDPALENVTGKYFADCEEASMSNNAKNEELAAWLYEKSAEWYLRRPKYSKPTKIDGKVVIITGANTGIGKANAIDLARRGSKIYIACRDIQRGEAALKEIKLASESRNVHFLQLDLASLDSIRQFAIEFHKKEKKLDILINNAGLVSGVKDKTKDGFELTFGVNHLGPFLLTNLLLDLLKNASPSRIVIVSSYTHVFGKINKDDLMYDKKYNGTIAYAQSKLANILFSNELSRRLIGTGVTVNSCHPGLVKTDIMRKWSFKRYYEVAISPWLRTPEEGAQTQIRLAVDPDLERVSGKYFSNCKETGTAKKAKDEELAACMSETKQIHLKLGIVITEEPEFTETIENVTVPAGRNVKLACSVKNLGSYKVAWMHFEQSAILTVHNHVITRNPRISVTHDKHDKYKTWFLHIANVQEEDKGRYMCQINTVTAKTQFGYVHVVVPPNIDDSLSSSDVIVREGSNITLKCRAHGSPQPTIKWKRDDNSKININKSLSVFEWDAEMLEITRISRLDMGAYLCIAQNSVPPSVSKRIKVSVDCKYLFVLNILTLKF